MTKGVPWKPSESFLNTGCASHDKRSATHAQMMSFFACHKQADRGIQPALY